MTENKQLDAWCGELGDTYTERNVADEDMMRARTKMWVRIMRPLIGDEPSSILEIGANLGLNIRALKKISKAK